MSFSSEYIESVNRNYIENEDLVSTVDVRVQPTVSCTESSIKRQVDVKWLSNRDKNKKATSHVKPLTWNNLHDKKKTMIIRRWVEEGTNSINRNVK